MIKQDALWRKVTYKLYPTVKQAALLNNLLRSHQQLYNAALEERISAQRMQRKLISYTDQCASLTQIRRELPEWAIPNCSSQQMTLRRLDKAFKAFFQRVQAGRSPGFPRFKSLSRFPGISFKSHGDGWKFTPGQHWKHGSLRLSGIGQIACRGRARDGGTICACDVCYRRGEWFLSLTVEPRAIVRPRTAHEVIALDWGLNKLLTGINEQGGVTEIDNPRLYQAWEGRITALRQAVSTKKRGSGNRKKAVRKLGDACAKMARIRNNIQHQLTSELARTHALIAMEDLTVKNMTASAQGTAEQPGKNVAQKAGLNREIPDTAPAALMQQLRRKVIETGGMWVIAPTKQLKPSQRCPRCGDVRKKTLSERVHACPCGYTASRDVAAAQVVLNWALYEQPAGAATRQELAAVRS